MIFPTVLREFRGAQSRLDRYALLGAPDEPAMHGDLVGESDLTQPRAKGQVDVGVIELTLVLAFVDAEAVAAVLDGGAVGLHEVYKGESQKLLLGFVLVCKSANWENDECVCSRCE